MPMNSSCASDERMSSSSLVCSATPSRFWVFWIRNTMIAMALVLDPKLLIADEPTTALDVTTQAQILALVRDLMREHGTGVLFITHDFGVVAEIADRVAVLKHGELVEVGTSDEVLRAPKHDYTRMLIAAVPSMRSSTCATCSRCNRASPRSPPARSSRPAR